jgi:hypothetical protein
MIERLLGAFNKLTRTFASQVEALKRYRSGGEQKMTVQHVHVAEGGQAIVGNVNAPTQGVGERKKSEVQPHAPGIAMPRQIETERATLPKPAVQGGLASAECTAPSERMETDDNLV